MQREKWKVLMELKIVFRRPCKMLLLCLLLVLALTASVLLSLQYSIDSLELDYARQYYSYCATIESTYSKSRSLDALADEPTGNLDDDNAMDVMKCLLSLAHDYEKLVIVVTHDADIAEMADCRYYLSKGELRPEE